MTQSSDCRACILRAFGSSRELVLPSVGLLLFSLTLSSVASAELTYEADIRPILKEHCFHCHGEQGHKEGELDLRLRRFLVKGGESGPAIAPGDADNSLLIQRVADGEMPPDDDKQLPAEKIDILRRWVQAKAPTARDEPTSLDDAPYFTEEERNWWAFRPLQRPAIPTLPEEARADIDAPIDAFLLARLQAISNETQRTAFRFAPVADRATLVRRIYLDMLGVPPTPAEVQAFIDDPHPAAWPRLVDRVLASPLYGERWGRHWLDVAGYADSEGYTDEDLVRENAWRYRDYVIHAFNSDKPYSQFIVEQLAGDELVGWPQAELKPEFIEPLAATGFLRMGPDGTGSNVDQDVARNQVVADTLEIVAGALLGVTVQCARCHDHRYDPIPQRDYYQLRAVFEPALNWKDWRQPKNRLVSLYTKEDKQRREEIESKAKAVDAARQEKVDFYIAKTLEHELLMVADELQEPLRTAFNTKTADRNDAQKKLLAGHVNIANITAGSLYLYDRRRDARAKDLDQRRGEKLQAFLERVKSNTLAPLDESTRTALLAAASVDPEKRSPKQNELLKSHPAVVVDAKTLGQFDAEAAAELERYATAAAEIRKYRIRTELQKFTDDAKKIREQIPKEHFLRITAEKASSPPETFVFHRGDHKQPKNKVSPQGLSVLGAKPLTAMAGEGLNSSGRRLQFARYLTDDRHPLPARVMANRIWAHHFGRGIVTTTADFGYLGARPTHPKLLDWLAAELMASGWSVKHLQRTVLLSRAYQQSSVASAAVTAADPDNQWLGRWPLQRMQAETLRDSVLRVTGRLNVKLYGEPVPVMEDGVGQIVLGKENLDGERKPTKPIPLHGEEFRRSVYVQVRRSRPLGLLENFDTPDLSPNCPDRPSSNVAPQSLMMMNSDFMMNSADAMADRLIRERTDKAEQLRWGWTLAYGVGPSEAQLEQAAAFLQLQTAAFAVSEKDAAKTHRAALSSYCQALFGSTRFLYIQ